MLAKTKLWRAQTKRQQHTQRTNPSFTHLVARPKPTAKTAAGAAAAAMKKTNTMT